ncbi:MAG: hypothetical protein HY652_10845, partial [Acidobacteria bacterium]|nr:hypothetical protein [Acidobacteriota bacterium]
MAVGRKLLSTLIGLLLAFSPPGFGQRPQSAPLVLEGGNLIDGTGAGVKPDPVIVIEGDRIRQVGPRGTLQYPA